MTLREALDEYKNVYMAYRNFAKRTRVEYQNDLVNFIEYIEKSGVITVKHLKLQTIVQYVAELEKRGFASLTRKRKVVTIRSFLMFLYQDGFIDVNIAKMVVLPYAESTTPNILTVTECNRLREASADNPRDRAIVELLLQTGIKLSELTRLTVDDIEFERLDDTVYGYVRIVRGRRKKDRLILMNDKLYQALKSYFAVRNNGHDRIFFLNKFDEPMGERGVQKMLGKYLKNTGIGRAGIHTLRHTFGAHHIAKGTDPKTIQEVMGLKDVRSAAVYQILAKEVIFREVQENA